MKVSQRLPKSRTQVLDTTREAREAMGLPGHPEPSVCGHEENYSLQYFTENKNYNKGEEEKNQEKFKTTNRATISTAAYADTHTQ